jgi:hypothetical protein
MILFWGIAATVALMATGSATASILTAAACMHSPFVTTVLPPALALVSMVGVPLVPLCFKASVAVVILTQHAIGAVTASLPVFTFACGVIVGATAVHALEGAGTLAVQKNTDQNNHPAQKCQNPA